MIKKTSQSGHVTYGLTDFILDNNSDIQNLPVDAPMGSTAFVIDTSTVYILNSSGEWKEIDI